MAILGEVKIKLNLDDVYTGVDEAKKIVDTLRPYIRQLIREEVQAAMDEMKLATNAVRPSKRASYLTPVEKSDDAKL